MSEPMTSVEIEDVLSSIRRLVSDDQRPRPQPMTTASGAGDRLVLTPALRIVPEPAQPETASTDASLPETVLQEPQDRVPLTAGVQDEVVFCSVRQAETEEAGFVAVEDDAPDPGVSPYDDDGAAAPVEGGAAIARAMFAASASVEAEVQPAPQPADWADEAEAAIRAELEHQTTNAAYARFLDEPQDVAFDESAMRELVRDIIREELQGALGERITRNVRKLVRVEIARAMAVRDFE